MKERTAREKQSARSLYSGVWMGIENRCTEEKDREYDRQRSSLLGSYGSLSLRKNRLSILDSVAIVRSMPPVVDATSFFPWRSASSKNAITSTCVLSTT